MISPYAWPGIAKPVLSFTPVYIVQRVCNHFEILVKDIKAKTRSRLIVRARWFCWALMRRFCPDLTLHYIARFMGIADHATVLHGLARLDDLMKHSEKIKKEFEAVTYQIKNNT